MLLARQTSAPRPVAGQGGLRTGVQQGCRQRRCTMALSHHPRRMPLASYDNEEQGDEDGDYDLIISQPPENCPLFFMLAEASTMPLDNDIGSSDVILWHCSSESDTPALQQCALVASAEPIAGGVTDAWTSACDMLSAEEVEQQLIACCTTVPTPPSEHEAFMALAYLHQDRHVLSPAALRADVPATLLGAIIRTSSALGVEDRVHVLRALLTCVPNAHLDLLAHRFDFSVLYEGWELCSASQLVGLLSDLGSASVLASPPAQPTSSPQPVRGTHTSHNLSRDSISSLHNLNSSISSSANCASDVPHSTSFSSSPLSSGAPLPAHTCCKVRHAQLAAHILRLPSWQQNAAQLTPPLALASITALSQLLRPLRTGADAPHADLMMRQWLQVAVPALNEQLDRPLLLPNGQLATSQPTEHRGVGLDQEWSVSRSTSLPSHLPSHFEHSGSVVSPSAISVSTANALSLYDAHLLQDPAQLVAALCTVQEVLAPLISTADRGMTRQLTRVSQQLSSRLAALPLQPDMLPQLPGLLLLLSAHPSLPKPRTWVPTLTAAVAARAPAVANLTWREALQLTVDAGLLLECASANAQRATRGHGAAARSSVPKPSTSPLARSASGGSGRSGVNMRTGGAANRARLAAQAAAAAANATADAMADAQKLRQQLLGHLRRRLLDAGLPGLWALSHAWSTSSSGSAAATLPMSGCRIPFDEELMSCVVGATEELAMLDVGCVQAPMLVEERIVERSELQPVMAMHARGGIAATATRDTQATSLSSWDHAAQLPSLSLHCGGGSYDDDDDDGEPYNPASSYSSSDNSHSDGDRSFAMSSMDGVSSSELMGLVYEGSMEGFGVAVRRLEEVCLHAGMAVETRLALFGRMRRTLMLRSMWGQYSGSGVGHGVGRGDGQQDSGDAWW